jgi:acyl carrier protein
MTHVNLVTAIERRYKVRFALGELQGLKNVGRLAESADPETGRELAR